MKYNLTRKINLKRFFPDMQYESIDFAVLEADSKEEANKELDKWVEQWLKDKIRDMNDKRTSEEKFSDGLDETPAKTLNKNEDIKQSKLLNKQ